MQLINPQQHSNASHLQISPGSTFILAYAAPNLEVRAASNLTLIRNWPLESAPDQTAWSPDGQYVLVSWRASCLIHVYIVDPRREGSDEPVARISTGAFGLRRVQWGPSGTNCLMAFATDELGMMIYSLVDGSKALIKDVKKARYYPHPTDPTRLAVLTRSHTTSLEQIQIYHYVNRTTSAPSSYTAILQRPVESHCASSWTLESSFATHTNDASSLSWSPVGNLLAIWESGPEYKLSLFTALGYWRGTFCVESGSRKPKFLEPESNCDTAFVSVVEQQEDLTTAPTTMGIAGGLSIRTVAWQPVHPDSPVGNALLAAGGYDEQVYFLTPFTDHPVAQGWGVMTSTLDLSKRTLALDGSTIVYREPRQAGEGITQFEASSSSGTVPVPALRPDWEKAHPKTGIATLEWDSTGQYLAVRNEAMPSTLFIYQIQSLVDEAGEFSPPKRVPALIAVVFFSSALVCCTWRPGNRVQLAIGTGSTTGIYFWDPAGVKRVAISPTSGATSLSGLKYSTDGRKLLVSWRGDAVAGDAGGAYCVALHDDVDARDDS